MEEGMNGGKKEGMEGKRKEMEGRRKKGKFITRRKRCGDSGPDFSSLSSSPLRFFFVTGFIATFF